MDTVGQYVLSVGCAALACAIAAGLLPQNGTVGGIAKTVTGLILTFVIVQPVTGIELSFPEDILSEIRSEAASVTDSGEEYRKEALKEVIKAKTEAYILDEAARLNLQLQVEVQLSDDTVPVPVAITIHGDASPYAKSQMRRMLKEELGISEENLKWM